MKNHSTSGLKRCYDCTMDNADSDIKQNNDRFKSENRYLAMLKKMFLILIVDTFSQAYYFNMYNCAQLSIECFDLFFKVYIYMYYYCYFFFMCRLSL